MKSIYNKKIFKERRKELRKKLTLFEKILWQCLNKKQISGYKFFRQYSVGSYILDFYCPKARLAIELDGEIHLPEENKKYDLERTKFLNGNNIKVIRFWNTEIIDNLDFVLRKIEDHLKMPLLR